MSATGRGAERRADDFYATPAWCVRRLLERLALPAGNWLEPCAGDGAIIRAVGRQDVTWTAVELRHEARGRLVEVVDSTEVFVGFDFVGGDFGGTEFAAVITNPPFSLALPFIEHALELAPWVVMLLRLNFLASAGRAEFFREQAPDVYVLPNRPSFTDDGRTDATEYAWFVWPPERGRRAGRLEVLAETPASERRAR